MVCRAYFKDKSTSSSKSKTPPKSSMKSNCPSKPKRISQPKAAPKAHPRRHLTGETHPGLCTTCFYAVVLLNASSEDFRHAMASCLEHSGYIFTNMKRASKAHSHWKRTFRPQDAMKEVVVIKRRYINVYGQLVPLSETLVKTTHPSNYPDRDANGDIPTRKRPAGRQP